MSEKKKTGGPKKSVAKKKPVTRKKASAKKKSGGRLRRWIPILILAALVIGIGGLLARDYHGRLVLEQVETLIGPLEADGVRLRVADGPKARELFGTLQRQARRSFGVLRLESVREDYGALSARLHYRDQTVVLLLYWDDRVTDDRWDAPSGGAPRLAIVIDDMGRSVEQAKRFLALPLALTPAIMPHESRSGEVAALATAEGREFLLHMPMEPRAYPDNNPGPGAILVELDEAETRQRLTAALEIVQGASGVNNHMGSRATEQQEQMGWVMAELAERGLFFLDSVTTGESRAVTAAKHEGLPWAARDVFIDNLREVEAIQARVDEALEVALERGHAVAIGHPYPETLEALGLAVEKIKASGVEIVPVSRLLRPAR